METREPTTTEIKRWNHFRNYFENVTGPKIKALGVLTKICQSAENEIETLTGTKPQLVTDKDKEIIAEIGRRGAIIDRLIQKVLLRRYGVQIDDDGNLTIVGAQADEGDVYPQNEINMGVAWLVVVGIAAAVLLLAGDQNNERLAADTENEAIKLQRRLIEQDIKLLQAPKEVRDRWVEWKDKSAKAARAALRDSPTTPGWFGKIFGQKGTSILIAGIVGIAAVYFLVPVMRRN